MNDISNLNKVLPGSEGEFQIDVEGDLTKKRYLGEFTCKIMNRKERAMVDKHKAFLNGEYAMQLDPLTLIYHHKIAYLRYALIGPYPKFWQNSDLGYELYDENVVNAIYEEVLKFEEQWMRSIWGDEAIEKIKGVKPDGEADGGEETAE